MKYCKDVHRNATIVVISYTRGNWLFVVLRNGFRVGKSVLKSSKCDDLAHCGCIARIMSRARCVRDGAVSSGIDYWDFGWHITLQGGFVVLRNGFRVGNPWENHQM